ncbi:MAG TPA: uroporphyrinogen-III C-methyltransferase [Candidatus Angelobacter sp.]|jgi:uroporphyrin-III C-methyltransferase
MPGRVYIVGAGPGAADLLTLRAASLLREAHVVLRDDLVPQEILDLCPRSAQIVNVGKRCGQHGSSQEQINALMVWYAVEDQQRESGERIIVRLKSGDPSVFGRLGEELDALRRAGVPFEVVPGITAAAAAAAAAEVTLTDRRAASALIFVTAHNCRNESLEKTIFDPSRSTYALYMPGPDYNRTARELVQSGLEPATPCAVVSNAGRANQQARFLKLAELASAQGIEAPALLIVGEVAREALPRRQGDTEKTINKVFLEQSENQLPQRT